MKVILLEKIQNLGPLGSIVNVKAGYARNFLLPFGKAEMATEEAIAAFELRKEELAKQAQDVLAQAQFLGEKLQGLRLEIQCKEHDEGQLYGSVGSQEIVAALQEQGFEVERRQVILPDGALQTTGEFPVALSLHAEVSIDITLVISPEE